ncbi:hypothetical protein D3C87_65610 [compost metagenome]
MKKLILLSILTLSGIFGSRSYGQTIPEGSNQILVRIFEAWSGAETSEIILSYGNQQSERIRLERASPKNWEYNTNKINEVLTNIMNAGFEIETSNMSGEAWRISTYIFKKKD